MITKKKIIYKDKRGEIIDIFVKNPKEHCTLVTFKKGSIRGNHYHKKTIQYTYVISGKLTLVSQKINIKNNKPIGKKKKITLSSRDFVKHNTFHAHAFKALEKSCILAFANGVRGGKNYSSDTFFLEKKLLI